MSLRDRTIRELRGLGTESPPLTATAIVMLAAFVASVVGIFIDSRIITGMPAWLKPSKFAISTAIYSATLAWLFGFIKVWPQFVKAMGWIIAFVLVLEVAIIDIQAARGTTSHFNAGTGVDTTLFAIMGSAIALLWIASAGVLVALFRQRFSDSAWGWSLRLGMLITVLGSAAGGLMIRMTPEQAEALRVNHSVTAVGGHTVGAPDGGPGLAGLGWSTEHGDLRVPHFFGLHGVQIVPFLGWLVARRRRSNALVFTIATSYLAFIGILTWQALRGQSILEPDQATAIVLIIWMISTLAAATVLSYRRPIFDRSTV